MFKRSKTGFIILQAFKTWKTQRNEWNQDIHRHGMGRARAQPITFARVFPDSEGLSPLRDAFFALAILDLNMAIQQQCNMEMNHGRIKLPHNLFKSSLSRILASTAFRNNMNIYEHAKSPNWVGLNNYETEWRKRNALQKYPPVHLPGGVVHWHPSPFCSILTLKTKEWPLELRKIP